MKRVALFTRAWIEIGTRAGHYKLRSGSPSSRGRGLKYYLESVGKEESEVALFTRAWIEIPYWGIYITAYCVALFTRAWIEIQRRRRIKCLLCVALFTRAWIEMR